MRETILSEDDQLDFGGVFAWLGRRIITGVERATYDSYERLLEVNSKTFWVRIFLEGHVLKLQTQPIPGQQKANTLGPEVSHEEELAVIVVAARNLFDLNVSRHEVDAALSEHEFLRPLVKERPGIRVPGALNPGEMLIRAIVNQQISVTRATVMLSELAGELASGPEFNGLRLFPEMAAVAAEVQNILRAPRSRLAAIATVASMLDTGELQLGSNGAYYSDANADVFSLREQLLAVKGIGPWTADYTLMRTTAYRDIFLVGDVAIRKGAKNLGLDLPPRELEGWATQFSPWRSYLNAHLWRVAG